MSAIANLFRAPPVSAPAPVVINKISAPLAAPRTGGDTAARVLAKRRAAAKARAGLSGLSLVPPLGRQGSRGSGETQTTSSLG